MSQITTQVVDTTKGRPAAGITVTLFEKIGMEWLEVATGITNKDGRISNLLREDNSSLPMGTYQLKFNTKEYFKVIGLEAFFPCVEIIFEIRSRDHYHIPLLLSPFGYSIYRGS
jgi:5-hydroxyisourate hydrolase